MQQCRRQPTTHIVFIISCRRAACSAAMPNPPLSEEERKKRKQFLNRKRNHGDIYKRKVENKKKRMDNLTEDQRVEHMKLIAWTIVHSFLFIFYLSQSRLLQYERYACISYLLRTTIATRAALCIRSNLQASFLSRRPTLPARC